MPVSFNTRIFSLIIDYIILLFVNMSVQIGLQKLLSHDKEIKQIQENILTINTELDSLMDTIPRLFIFYIILQYLIVILYFIISWYHFQQTIGMYIMNIKIIHTQSSEKPNLYLIILRLILSITYPIGGFLCIFFTKNKQAFHELISHTMLIHNQSK